MASDQAPPSQYPPGYLEEYNGNGPLAVAIVFIVLEILCVTLRFWARKIGKVAWGADDSLIILGVIFCLAVIGASLGDLHSGGVGYHYAAVAATAPSKLITWLKYFLIIPMMYLPAVVIPKLAILVMYLRIFTKRTDRIICWVVAALMIANLVGAIIVGFFICTPLEFLWHRTIPGGHCLDINGWYRWSSLMNIFTDVVMLIQPLPTIWKIQCSKKVKIGLTITFATGSIGLVTSLIRFSGFFKQDASEDGTWAASKLIILTIIESGIYLIAACLPTYRPLAVLLWKQKNKLSSYHFGSRTNDTEQSQTRDKTYEILLESGQKNSPIHANGDKDRFSSGEGEGSKQAEDLRSASNHSRHIVLTHDVSVTFDRPRANDSQV